MKTTRFRVAYDIRHEKCDGMDAGWRVPELSLPGFCNFVDVCSTDTIFTSSTHLSSNI